MNLEYRHLIPEDFNPASKAWVYQSNRLFGLSEMLEIEVKLEQFLEEWRSHGDAVKGFATVFFGRFIVLMADDSTDRLCGRAGDASLRFVKQLEQEFKVSLLDRQLLGFVVKDKIETLPYQQVSYALQNGFLNADTIFFNNTVQTKAELLERWMVPVSESWLAQRFQNLLQPS